MASVDDAREALYAAIKEAADDLRKDANAYSSAGALRDLAWAWRAVTGGPQPGVSVIEK